MMMTSSEPLRHPILCIASHHCITICHHNTGARRANNCPTHTALIACNKNGSDIEPVTPIYFSKGYERAKEGIEMGFEPYKKAGIKQELLKWFICLSHVSSAR